MGKTMLKNLEIELKVGLFVTLGVGLIMVAILVLGSTQNLLSRQNDYIIHFKSVEGMIPGAKVVLGGVTVGTVETIDLDSQTQDIRVKFGVNRKFQEWIRGDSKAEIATQGVLGDKYVILSAGTQEFPALPDGSEIQTKPMGGLNQFLSKGDNLMAALTKLAADLDHLVANFESGKKSETFFQGVTTAAKNLSQTSEKLNKELDGVQLKSAIKNLNSILEKVNNGSGTLGALINDPSLYDDIKALVGGANRNRIVRNLVRQTIKKADSQGAKPEAAPATDPKALKQ